MPSLSESQVREATQKPENIRCVSIIGARGHGKTTLARNLVSHHGLNIPEQAGIEVVEANSIHTASLETTQTEVHILAYLHSGSVGPAGAQSPYHPDSLRGAIRELDEPFLKVDGVALAISRQGDGTQVNSSSSAPGCDVFYGSAGGSDRAPSNQPALAFGFTSSQNEREERKAVNPEAASNRHRGSVADPLKRKGPTRKSKTARGSLLDAAVSVVEPTTPATGASRPKGLRKQKTMRMVPPLLTYLLDTPGHADFTADAQSSLRLSDGAIVVVDVVEDCLAHLGVLLRHSSMERVRPVLFVNGLDRCILELRMSPQDIHRRLHALIAGVNASLTDGTDELLGDALLYPEKGDATFGSTLHGWGISVKRFAIQYAAKFGLDADALAKRIWDNSDVEFPDVGTEDDVDEASSRSNSKGSAASRTIATAHVLAHNLGARVETPRTTRPNVGTLLASLVLAPVAQLVRALADADWPRVDVMVAALGMELSDSDRALQGPVLISRVMSRWINLSDVVLDMVKMRLPSPQQAQNYRVENLYGGSVDDIPAIAIRNCDPQGPLMVFISRMLPSSEGQLYGLGRVFSGTLVEGSPLWLRSSHRRGGVDDSQLIQSITGAALPALPLIPCASLQCGNMCAILNVDQFLLKAGTLTDCRDAADLTTMHFSTVRPVVRVAVKATDPADLPKLTEALRRLSKIDPLAESAVEEWGEHVLRGSGRRHLDACLEALRGYLQPAEFVPAAPNKDPYERTLPGTCDAYHIAYRETVHEESSKNSCSASPDGTCQMEASAEPLGAELCTDVEAGLLGHAMDVDERAHALVDHYSWSKADASRIWCFSPITAGANFVIDETNDNIGRSNLSSHLWVQGAVSGAYQWATQEGALCEESTRGIRFNVKDVRLHAGSTRQGSGQIIGTARRCFLAAQLAAAPGLQEPILHCGVICQKGHTRDAAYGIVTDRRGTLLSETPVEHSDLVRLVFELPASSTLDLDIVLAEVGCTCPAQSSFSHWSSLPGDPRTPGGHQDVVLGLRRWRHLEVVIPTPDIVLGPGSKMTPADVFADELLDLIVPSL